ncbi:hypothetical protein DPMN_046441 [Dreissena polymorpha]|uniref:Uncharacterized protein n=1 Tax=Dreissena polymorpha TaxID=45954 RepID=A0A9D4D7U8_DREPO|nr:hypothetical protein DPMN_046441 [Dreissena polymorpha]
MSEPVFRLRFAAGGHPRLLSSKQAGALFYLTTKQAFQLCADLRAAEHVDGEVEGGVEVGNQLNNVVQEQKEMLVVRGCDRIP